jgi:hypothetical protein
MPLLGDNRREPVSTDAARVRGLRVEAFFKPGTDPATEPLPPPLPLSVDGEMVSANIGVPVLVEAAGETPSDDNGDGCGHTTCGTDTGAGGLGAATDSGTLGTLALLLDDACWDGDGDAVPL